MYSWNWQPNQKCWIFNLIEPFVIFHLNKLDFSRLFFFKALSVNTEFPFQIYVLLKWNKKKNDYCVIARFWSCMQHLSGKRFSSNGCVLWKRRGSSKDESRTHSLEIYSGYNEFYLTGIFRDPSCSLELLVSSGTKVLWEFLHYVSVRKSQLLASRT